KSLVPLARIVLCVAVALLSSVMVLTRGFDHEHALLQTVGLSLLALAFGALLVLTVGAVSLARVFAHRSLRWFGKYSYGMYVWHPIIFVLVWHSDIGRELRGGNSAIQVVGSTVAAMSITLIVTLLSFHLVEKKFLRLKRRFETAPAAPALEVVPAAPAPEV